MKQLAILLLSLMPWATAAAEIDPLQMVGQARLKVMFWPVYESRLYSPDGSYVQGGRPLRLDIQYLRDVEADDLLTHTRKEWERLRVTDANGQKWLSSLAGLWPDVGENDVLSLVVDEQDRSVFLLNGQVLGSIDDPRFGEAFLGIWLSPETSRPDLRLGLLGLQ